MSLDDAMWHPRVERIATPVEKERKRCADLCRVVIEAETKLLAVNGDQDGAVWGMSCGARDAAKTILEAIEAGDQP